MKLKYTLFFLFALVQISVLGQGDARNVVVAYGATIPSIGKIVGSDHSGCYYYRRDRGKIFLEHLNRKREVDRSVECPEVNYRGNKANPQSAWKIGSTICVMYASRGSSEVMILAGQKYDASTFSPVDSLVKISESVCLTPTSIVGAGLDVPSEMFYTIFNIKVVGDSVMIVTGTDWFQPKKHKKDRIVVRIGKYNGNLERELYKEVVLREDQRNFNVTQIYSHKESIEIVGVDFQWMQGGSKHLRASTDSKEKFDTSFTYYWISVVPGDAPATCRAIRLDNQRVCDIVVTSNANDEVIFAGYYGGRYDNCPRGVFCFHGDPSARLINNLELTPFGQGFFSSYFWDEGGRRLSDSIYQTMYRKKWVMNLQELVPDHGGDGFVMIAEQYTWWGTNSITNDIYIHSFNNSGKVVWSTKIKKSQLAPNVYDMPCLSYKEVHDDKSFHFVFNDDGRNAGLDAAAQPWVYYCSSLEKKNTRVVRHVEIDFKGNILADEALEGISFKIGTLWSGKGQENEIVAWELTGKGSGSKVVSLTFD